MLPLNELENLTKKYQVINEEKRKLQEKEKQLSEKAEILSLTAENMKKFEVNVEAYVRLGLFTMSHTFSVTKDTKKEAMLNALEEISNQGFNIEEITTIGNYNVSGKTKTLTEFKEKVYPGQYKEKKGYGCWFDKIIVKLNWKDFTPNPEYEAPPYEEELKKLNTKIEKLKKLNEEAEHIILH